MSSPHRHLSLLVAHRNWSDPRIHIDLLGLQVFGVAIDVDSR
jgi:hypothetical protein